MRHYNIYHEPDKPKSSHDNTQEMSFFLSEKKISRQTNENKWAIFLNWGSNLIKCMYTFTRPNEKDGKIDQGNIDFLVEEYRRLITLAEPSDMEEKKIEEILELATSNPKLSHLLDQVDEQINVDLGLNEEAHFSGNKHLINLDRFTDKRIILIRNNEKIVQTIEPLENSNTSNRLYLKKLPPYNLTENGNFQQQLIRLFSASLLGGLCTIGVLLIFNQYHFSSDVHTRKKTSPNLTNHAVKISHKQPNQHHSYKKNRFPNHENRYHTKRISSNKPVSNDESKSATINASRMALNKARIVEKQQKDFERKQIQAEKQQKDFERKQIQAEQNQSLGESKQYHHKAHQSLLQAQRYHHKAQNLLLQAQKYRALIKQ